MSRPSRLVGGTAAVAVALVGAFEGLRTVAYRDPIGIPTICFGSTKGVRIGDRKTVPECEALLIEELRDHELGMRLCMKEPDKVPEGAYIAFLSFTYNVGVGAFCKSTLRKKADAGDLRGACAELSRWDKAAGIRLPGLTKRRAEERKMCEASL